MNNNWDNLVFLIDYTNSKYFDFSLYLHDNGYAICDFIPTYGSLFTFYFFFHICAMMLLGIFISGI